MFLKSVRKYCKTDKTYYPYYRLCESYRDECGFSRQRMVLGVGRLEELPEITQKEAFIDRINQLIKGTPKLFQASTDPTVERLALHYYQELRLKNKIDVATPGTDSNHELVNLKTLKNKDVREIGAESLCYQAFTQLKIASFLRSRQWSDEDINLAATHVISRAVYPASEYKTVSWIKENSSVCELTGYDKEKLTKDKLYRIAHKLYKEKEGLENHLSRCTNELFNLEDTIILYDLTNTYFEGQMKKSQLAKFGRSKEKRSDAKLIVLALVVNTEGFLKYSNIFQGNTADSATLENIVTNLDKKAGYRHKRPVIVMDAGIATEANIQFLKQENLDYLCVSRSNLKNYRVANPDEEPTTIKDKKGHPIELLHVQAEDDNDTYLWVKSQTKALKENSMNSKFSQRFEEGLLAIRRGITSKGGTKKLDKVWERIGRLKERYPSIHQYYEITVTHDNKGTATDLTYKEIHGQKKTGKVGVYFLRTSLDTTNEKTLWTIYNALREIENTFRVLKTDIDLRPIFHKTDEASMAHLHLGLLAYWLVSTIRYQLKLKGINHQWREIVRIMNTQKRVTTTVQNKNGSTIQIRQCSQPSHAAELIYQKLNYHQIPLPRKKSVWHPKEKIKKYTFVNQQFNGP